MLDLEKIKSSDFFTLQEIQAWETLLKEGDIDEYLYIIYSGELIVEKSINTLQDKFKVLSHLWPWDILWEASLRESHPKQVQIRASQNTRILKIHGKKDFPKFVSKHPQLWYDVLMSVISIANSRLTKANREVTANYEVSIAISKIKDFSASSIYKLLLIFESILEVDQIMYFEKNLVVDHYFKLKYNSLNKHSLQNSILKLEDDNISQEKLTEESIKVSPYIRSAKLSLGEINYGFLVVWKKDTDFTENEEKLLTNIASSLVWVIHQKKLIDDQKNKNYIKSI